ncbi:MAG: RyR domain-containing protein [Calditrichaceae bacterium]
MKIRDLEWWIVGVLGIIAFILAMIGFNIMFTCAGIERNMLDLAFQSMKIFGMEFVDEFASPLPVQLEIARWLAPLVVLYTAAKAIIYFVRREFRSLLIKFNNDHIIITSLNDKSRFLINDLLAKNEKVIVVASIDSPGKLDLIEKDGAILIEGSISDQRFLKNIAAHKARYMMFMEDDDEKNISSAISVYQFLEKYGKDKIQTLFVHVADDLKLNELKELSFFEEFASGKNINEVCDIRIFSMNERTSRILFNKYSPDIFTPVHSSDAAQLHVALFGSNDLTQSMIIRLARLGRYANLKKLKITLFHEGDRIVNKLKNSFPALNQLIDLDLIDAPLDMFDIEIFDKIHIGHPFSSAYILCKDDALSSYILNKLSKTKSENKIDVIIGLMNPDGILNKWYTGRMLEKINLHKFNLIEESFTKNAIISEEIDKLAMIIHQDYLSKLKKRDPAKLSHQDWAALPVDFKNQNREQADHLYVKLRAMNCEALLSGQEKGKSVSISNDSPFMELLAEMEHDRWQAHMLLNGWTYNKTRDDQKKYHTDLVPYNQLSEEVKDWDRNAIANMPVLLSKLGFVIRKL